MPKKKAEEETTEIVRRVSSVDDKNLAMSNVLISSKYKATVQELKITYLALQKVQMGNYTKEGENIYIRFTGRELKEAIGTKGNSFFERLVKTAQHMTGRTIGIVEPENRRFLFVPFITMAKYENGELTVRFAPEMEHYILNIEKNFTYLLKDTMMDFKKEYSFKLYEVLKSYSFYPKDYKLPKNGKFQVELGLSELKLTMGVINAELDAVKNVLYQSTSNPDYDKAVAKSPERLYDDWISFRRRILEPAIKEINEKTDIEINFVPLKRGMGGKIYAIQFNVQDKKYISKEEQPPVTLNKKDWTVSARPSDQERFVMITRAVDEVSDITILKYEETVDILEDANYDFEYFKEKVELLRKQKLDADFNVVGWLRKACQENWKEGSKPTAEAVTKEKPKKAKTAAKKTPAKETKQEKSTARKKLKPEDYIAKPDSQTDYEKLAKDAIKKNTKE